MQTNSKKRWAILALLVMSPFMATLDSSIINVALPVMADSFGVSSGTIAWVVSSYLIVISATILLLGRLGDIVGHIRVLQWGMLFFTVGSFLCGLSRSFELLVAFRIVQALGAAGMMSTNQGIITRIFSDQERGRALGINAAFVALGTLLGPAVGGFILSVASWKYIFLVNVPVGVAALIVGHFIYPKMENATKGRLDVAGAALFALSVTALFIALGQIQSLGFTHPLILVCLVLFIVSFVLFVVVQNRSRSPLIQLTIFKNRWFSVSIFCAFTSYLAISCSNIVLPFYLQDCLRYGPAQAGMFMMVYPLVVALAAPVSGYLADKTSAEVLTLMGLLLTAAGLFFLSTLDAQPRAMQIVMYTAIMALGNGMFQSPNNTIVMASVPRTQVGVGGSVNALVRNLGYTLGVAVAT
ncbi:MAG: DHA2 family efflux MFS transporter permease subunit, partial [Acetanaerobacterium sp.]